MRARSLLIKIADLLPDVQLQPHQQRLTEESEEHPIRKLLFHALGSGKSLSALAVAEAPKQPYLAVTPASLRANFQKEREKFTNQAVPYQGMSYSELAMGRQPTVTPHTVIFDEAHRLRNPGAAQTQAAMRLASKAKQLLLLSGSPVINDPSDLAVPISMLTQSKMSPGEFRQRYVAEKTVEPGFWAKIRGVPPGKEEDIQRAAELKKLLKGKIDYFAPPTTTVPVKHEDYHTEMGPEQSQLYKAMWEELPWATRWKLKNDFPLNSQELQRSVSFLTGPRQIGLSTYPYLRNKDPMVAFQQSPKLQKAHTELQRHLADPRKKALIFSNFIDAGLTPYAAKLQEQGIAHAVFHGGLNDAQRKKLVEDYNTDKIRVALLGPSGTEGLSFRGTNLVQLLDPHFNPTRGRQAEGRSLRFDSHSGLDEDLRDVTVQRFTSRMPLGFVDRMLSQVGFNYDEKQRTADHYLRTMSERKDKLNQKFLALLKDVGSQRT